mmetsp:Transcript_6961/g.14849  ORF Transcript_6961/g.14849 Transcript_6961/m.14849 type:complete len:327 (+) Transcript_6961:211-1191(+)
MQSLRALSATFAAGFGGAYAYEHSDGIASSVLRTLADLSRPRNSRGSGANAGSGGEDGTADAVNQLSGQVNTLSDRLTDMMQLKEGSGAGRIVVVGGATPESYAKNSISLLLSLAGTAAVLAAVAYTVARMRGVSYDDVAWVSKSMFDRSTQLLKASITKLSGALAVLRDEIEARLRNVEDKVEDSRVEVLSAVSTEVGRATDRINCVSSEVTAVQRLVSNVQLQMDELHARMGYANHGIYLLCQVVAQLPESYSGAGDELRRFAALQPGGAGSIGPGPKQTSGRTLSSGAASTSRPSSGGFNMASGLGSLLDDRHIDPSSRSSLY